VTPDELRQSMADSEHPHICIFIFPKIRKAKSARCILPTIAFLDLQDAEKQAADAVASEQLHAL
jgi:hypothetical protein